MDLGSVVGVLIALLLIALVAVVVWSSVRIVREYQRLVVFRLGRSTGARGPGLVLLIPGIDRGIHVDLREQFIQVPHQKCITRDNAPVDVDCLIYMYVVDAVDSVVQVQNYLGAAQGMAMTTLRSVVGDISLDDVLAKREQINTVLRTKLDEVTERWGVKVNSVEIREIIPPREVQEAMNRQLSAERGRRAIVTEAEGKREAAVTVATGEKQAAILASEGARQSSILRAEGSAQALETIYGAARLIDAKTMSLQYLDTLRSLGDGPSTKFVIPMEFTSMLQPLLTQAGNAMAASSGSNAAPSNGAQTSASAPASAIAPPSAGAPSETNGHQVPAPVPALAQVGPADDA
jgi:regulator of protease activity HflC (stomatin/prohibitin superfamily)